jgi:1-aminocyclopropane-1-carboxylate deaminase
MSLSDFPRYPLMFGLIDLIRTSQIARDSTVLYAHLGGQPALNAYSALFR